MSGVEGEEGVSVVDIGGVLFESSYLKPKKLAFVDFVHDYLIMNYISVWWTRFFFLIVKEKEREGGMFSLPTKGPVLDKDLQTP